jgi:glycosyltransferase involved in cell wall biosynthesis
VDGTTETFVKRVIDLLRDDDTREQLGKEGRSVVEEHFTIAAMGNAHRLFYEKLLD